MTALAIAAFRYDARAAADDRHLQSRDWKER
jgi:hypothetical protein